METELGAPLHQNDLHSSVFTSTFERRVVKFSPLLIFAYELFTCGILEAATAGISHYVQPAVACQTLSVLMLVPVVVLVLWLNYIMFRRVRVAYISPTQVFLVYFATNLAFASIYWSSYVLGAASAFTVHGFDERIIPEPLPANFTAAGPDHATAFLTFLYFAVTTTTTTGFGDIYPKHWATDVMTAVQMIVAAVYTLGIFALCMAHFNQRRSAGSAKSREGSFKGHFPLCSRFCVERCPGLNGVRKFVLKWLFPFSLSAQIFTYAAMLGALGADGITEAPTKTSTGTLCVLLQMVQILLLLFVTMRVVSKLEKGRLSASFLIQAYLSIVLAFGGLYFTLFVMLGSSSFYMTPSYTPTGNWQAVVRLLTFSVVTTTSTGYGEVYAVHLLPRLMVTLHMGVSTVFTVVMLGLGVSNLAPVLKDTTRVPLSTEMPHLATSPVPGSPQPLLDDEDDTQELLRRPGARSRHHDVSLLITPGADI